MPLLINIDVPDVAAAARFYEAAFGFKQVRTLFGGKIAELEHEGQLIHLLTKPEGAAAFADGPPRAYARHWTPLHLDILVSELDAALDRAQSAGAHLERPPTDHAWGRIAGVADPFGNGFCLIQLSAEGYGAVAG